MSKASRLISRTVALAAGAVTLLATPLALEVRLKQAAQPLTDAWQHLPIAPRRSTLLGFSFRPPQVVALGLDAHAILQTLLTYPFQLIRLGAYWNRIESERGAFYTDELDWQIDAADRAGKQIILCVEPLKTFSYPEFFVPAHRLPRPFPDSDERFSADLVAGGALSRVADARSGGLARRRATPRRYGGH